MQAFLFLTALAAASAVDCRKRTIPDFLCLFDRRGGADLLQPRPVFGVLAALPLLIAALIRPECMGGGDIKLTAAAGFVLGLLAGDLGAWRWVCCWRCCISAPLCYFKNSFIIRYPQ